MTTAGHILPGYYDYPEDVPRPSYSRRDFRRVKTAYVGRTLVPDEDRWKFARPVDSTTLDQIKQSARDLWLSDCPEPTTYTRHYREDRVTGHPPSVNRPTSPSRRNKPHPQPIFLTCRLHHVPGYHNADATVGKPVYVVDGATTGAEREAREQARAKFIPRPHTSAARQYRQKYQALENLPSRVAQATEAWLNIVNDDDKQKLLDELRLIPPKQVRPTMPVAPPSPHGPPPGAEHSCSRAQERPQTSKPRLIYEPVPRRGDYLLHPKWPPTLDRHKLPCMC